MRKCRNNDPITRVIKTTAGTTGIILVVLVFFVHVVYKINPNQVIRVLGVDQGRCYLIVHLWIITLGVDAGHIILKGVLVQGTSLEP